MTSLNNNNIREDVVFKGKVKDTLLRNSGSGGLVNVLLDFNARDAAAVQAHNSGTANTTATTFSPTRSSSSSTQSPTSGDGLTYVQFCTFLSDYGVELTPFEQQYLCRAFDDHGSGVISASTFTRHLTGLNERRLRAVKKAWAALTLSSSTAGESGVPREALLSAYEEVQTQRSGGGKGDGDGDAEQKSVLASTFSDRTRHQLKETYLASTTGRGAATNEADNSGNQDDVTYAEFVAFYAGVSAQFGTDEDFVAFALKSWAADDTKRPTLAETHREWGPDGDPLALDGPRLVQDALERQLGVSSKAYNFSHMQREQPYVEPLPPLSRPEIMATTTQRTYVPFDDAQRTLANPLATRRGQAM